MSMWIKMEHGGGAFKMILIFMTHYNGGGRGL